MVVARLRAAIDRVLRRVMLVVARGVVINVDDSGKLQTVQLSLLNGEKRTLERFQQYGLTSRPFLSSEGAAVFIGGNRDHGICFSVDDRRYRLVGLQEGEVAIYDDQGQVVHLQRSGKVQVTALTQATVTAPTVVVNHAIAGSSITVDATGVSILGGPTPGVSSQILMTPTSITLKASVIDFVQL